MHLDWSRILTIQGSVVLGPANSNCKFSLWQCLAVICACRWECLKDILLGDWTDGILCSFGMPVINGSERYNCQVLCFNRKIIMIRPKMWLANDGNYRELRWFTAWKSKDQLIDFQLPFEIAEALQQKSAPFGYGYIQFLDTWVQILLAIFLLITLCNDFVCQSPIALSIRK